MPIKLHVIYVAATVEADFKKTTTFCYCARGERCKGRATAMPELKSRMLFISHAWRYDDAYNTLVGWFDEEPNFLWKNCSVPSDAALSDKTTRGLCDGLTRQINPAQGVLIIAGMYAAHSGWIDYEIGEALRLKKTIIGVKPWGQERMPIKVQNASNVIVNWQRASIVKAVRDYI